MHIESYTVPEQPGLITLKFKVIIITIDKLRKNNNEINNFCNVFSVGSTSVAF